MNRSAQNGVTLVELMVALVIGLIAALVIQQVMAMFEGQKRTSTGGADAQVNGAVALFSFEREIRQSGYGLFGGSGPLCPLGINISYGDSIVADGTFFRPVTILDGGVGPDAVEFMRSDAELAAVPNLVVAAMAGPSGEISVASAGGLRVNQTFLVAGKDAGKVCSIMQMSEDPELDGANFKLYHSNTTEGGATFPFNRPDPANPPDFTTKPIYDIGDMVVNMGGFVRRRYQVNCNRLTEVDPTLTPGPYDCANTTPIVDHIVDVQAQYGIAPAGSLQITQWCNATAVSACGDWSNPGPNDVARIRAVRIAVVARSVQFERDQVSPASLALWDAGDPGDAAPVRALTDDERRFRYKVFSTIVPIRNVIWGGSN